MAVESLKEILARVIQDDVDILLHKDELVSRLKDEMPGRLQMEFSPLRIAIEDLNAGEIFYKIKRAELPAQLEELRKRLIGLSLNDEKADAVVECFRYAIETNWDSANEEDYSEAIQESETYIATGLADNYAENITPDVWYCHRGHQCTGNFCGICGETRVISENPAIEEPTTFHPVSTVSPHPVETVSSLPPQEPAESNFYNNSIAATKEFGQNKKIIIAIAALALVAIVGSFLSSTQNDKNTESKPVEKIEQSVKEEQSIKEQLKDHIFATKDDQYEYYIDPKSMLRYPPHFLADIIRVDVSKKRIFDRVVFDFTVDGGHLWYASDKMGHGEVSRGLIGAIRGAVQSNLNIGIQNVKEFNDNGKFNELNSIVNDKLHKISTAKKATNSTQNSTQKSTIVAPDKKSSSAMTKPGSTQNSTEDTPEKKAARVLQSFHREITKKNYRSAYNHLSDDFKRVVSYEGWAPGFKTTVSSQADEIRPVSASGNRVELKYKLKAVDDPGGVKYFNGTAIIINTPDGWKIDDLINKQM